VLTGKKARPIDGEGGIVFGTGAADGKKGSLEVLARCGGGCPSEDLGMPSAVSMSGNGSAGGAACCHCLKAC